MSTVLDPASVGACMSAACFPLHLPDSSPNTVSSRFTRAPTAPQAGRVLTVAGSVWDVARAAEAHGALAFNTNGHLKTRLASLADLRSKGREWGGRLAERGGMKGLFVRVGGP